jgi:hypothetical protein
VKKPTWIGSISRTGVVEIKFYKDVFVPNFTNPASVSNTKRRLDDTNTNTSETLDYYITNDVLSVQLE